MCTCMSELHCKFQKRPVCNSLDSEEPGSEEEFVVVVVGNVVAVLKGIPVVITVNYNIILCRNQIYIST